MAFAEPPPEEEVKDQCGLGFGAQSLGCGSVVFRVWGLMGFGFRVLRFGVSKPLRVEG